MGLLILFMMIVYITVSYFIVRIFYKFTNKKILSIFLFVGLITFPFWDLIAQKAIKTYYINSGLLEPKIYAMPEKDKDGKIESLSDGILLRHIQYGDLNDKGKINSFLIKQYPNLKEKVKSFIVLNSINDKYETIKIKLFLNRLSYEIIDNLQGRYSIKRNEKQTNIFSLSIFFELGIYDNYKDKFVAKTLIWCPQKVKFMENIRTEYFLLQSASGSGSAILGVSCKNNIKQMKEQFFQIEGI